MSSHSARRLAGLLVGIVALIAFSSSAALASGPPIVTINPTSEHTLNTAVASGTVDKNGASSMTYKFEYGKSKLYGQSTKEYGTITSGAVPVSEVIAGLESLTTYHVRLSATNSFGTTTSEDIPFEMLLQWKVAGKGLSAYPGGVPYAWEQYPEPLPTFKVTGNVLGGVPTEITCKPSTNESLWAGQTLGSYYPMAWDECKTLIWGEAVPECNPKAFTMNLGSTLMAEATKTKLEFNAGCSIGPSVNMGRPGFALKAMAEAAKQTISMTANTGGQFPGTATISNFKWRPAGLYAGYLFGIS
jgi:hypothetical protein